MGSDYVSIPTQGSEMISDCKTSSFNKLCNQQNKEDALTSCPCSVLTLQKLNVVSYQVISYN